MVRVAATPQNQMIMTLLCEACGRQEVDGLVESGTMRDEGGLLINPKYEQTLIDAIMVAGENAEDAPEKVPESLEGDEPTYQGADLGDEEDSNDE